MKADIQIQHAVAAQLEWEPSIDASQIGVAAKEGVVTLTGSVANYAAKIRAEKAAKRVFGVKGVANDIEVKIPGLSKRNDADIAAAALNALRWDASIPDDQITVTVSDGRVTLEGHVEWQYQREAAFDAVHDLVGVRGVSNQIAIKVRIKPAEIKQKIEAAFQRNAQLDARRVTVEAHERKVVLNGSVRSWNEREEAQRAAWAAPGVVEVENYISVAP